MEKSKTRVFYYDVIRAVACMSILTIHFNASFSAWSGGTFTYPNAVFPNHIFNQSVYLGDFGVSLFFILSGATIFRSYGNCDVSLGEFYKKRFLSIYPMFWMAWFAAMAVGMLVYGGLPSGGLGELLTSLSGMDGYLMSLGHGGLSSFYKVGEWFLGCILVLYLIMPLLLWGMKKKPLLTLGLSILVAALFHAQAGIFFLRRIPEIVIGMAFDRYFTPKQGEARVAWSLGALAGIVALSLIGPKLLSLGYGLELCVGICTLSFLLLALLFQGAPKTGALANLVCGVSRYSYPAFLVHHQVCDYMAKQFYLPELPKWMLYFAFLVYLVITALLSMLLTRVGRPVTAWLKRQLFREEAKQEPADSRQRLLRGVKALPIVALIPIQFFGVIPLTLYQANAGDMRVSLGAVLVYCLIFFLLSVAVFTLIGAMFSEKGFARWRGVLFAGGVLLYLQSNFLFIKLGVLSGQEFDLSQIQGRIWGNLLLWVAGVAAVVFLAGKWPAILEKVTWYGSMLLVSMQALVLVLSLVMPGQSGGQGAETTVMTTRGFNELSRDKNAVIFVLDMYDDTYMTEVLEKNPDLAQRLDGFTRYTNVTGKYSSTAYGLPFVITQQPLLNQGGNYGTMLDQTYKNSEMLNTLLEKDYRFQLYTDKYFIPDFFVDYCYNAEPNGRYVISNPILFAQLMTKLTLLRGGPDILKNRLSLSTDQFDKVVSLNLHGAEAHTTTGILPYQKMRDEEIQTVDPPVFSVIHIRGGHYPYEIDENGQQVEVGSVTCYEQALGALRTVLAYLEHMQAAGVYDNSTVIITADHGYCDVNGPIASTALLVKQINEHGAMRFNDAPVSQDNIQDFIVADAVEGYQAKPRTGPRVFYSYIFDASNYFDLTEWYVSDESNKLESFSPSGYQYDKAGNRVLLADYVPYTFGETVTFSMGGPANVYFDYGIGSAAYGVPKVVGIEGELSFSYQAVKKDMLFTLCLDNAQDSSFTIAAVCNGQDCGTVTLEPGVCMVRWKIPADCLRGDKAKITLRYEGLEQDPWGVSDSVYYDYWCMDEYRGEDLSVQSYVVSALEDFQAQMLSYEWDGNDLMVNVKNTSGVNWCYEDRVRCHIRLDGGDTGIRAQLAPGEVVAPGGEVTFRFVGALEGGYWDHTVEVQMLQEGFAYFGDLMEVSADG